LNKPSIKKTGSFLHNMPEAVGITFEIQVSISWHRIFFHSSKKSIFMKRILLLVLCSVTFTTIYAQDNDQKRYTASGGVLGALNNTKFRVSGDNSPNIKYETKMGWSVGGWLNLPVSGGFSIEPQVLYSSHRYLTDNTTTLLLNDGNISYISVPLVLKFHLGDKLAIIAGPQVDFLTSVDDENNVVTEEDGFKKSSFSLFGGIEALPHKRISIFARYVHGLTNMNDGASHTASALEYKNSNIQVGLKLRLFGGKLKTEPAYQATSEPLPLDSDGDGINDGEDKCPSVAGLAKYNGCPIPDSDGDGINDEEDKCPNVAGLAKYSGCPIPDSDGDGMNDEEDKCPNEAGIAKYNGCPVPDKDGDGINDEEDKCPDIAGIAGNNGCPEVPANVSKSLGSAAQSIAFGTGTNNAVLTTRSNASLDKIVTIMNENPGLHIRVEAHTDNAGDEDANENLSSERAKAVKAYLVSKGIDEDRIATEGFGESQPIADNNTAAGRAKNRRVEIRIAY
jgi:outer membrane protein OmpA-like peptidoglycan-associated protein